MEKRILWIEDDAIELESLTWGLKDRGYEIDVAFDAKDAISMVHKDSYDLIILDILLPTGEKNPKKSIEFPGEKLIEEIRKHGFNIPTIAITVVSDAELERRLKDFNILKMFTKGRILPSQLLAEVDDILLR